MSPDRRTALMILAALPGMGPVRLQRLDHALEGGVEALFGMEEGRRRSWCSASTLRELSDWRRYFDPGRVRDELNRLGAGFVTFEDAEYPASLQPYADRPVGLYRCLGNRRLDAACIAIVGTRQPSSYGRKVARLFARELANQGFTIVSGLAEGIDTEAHRAALDAGGPTAAILGGGLNRCYPASNRELMELIKESAGVWTEFPLWRSADRRSFPQRNRIVAGVSVGVVVVESGAAGGSLITARMAAEQGKPVYVVPGRIDAPESSGCHALIRDGAQLVTSVEEILEDLQHLPGILRTAMAPPARGGPSPTGAAPELDGLQAQVWGFLGEVACAHPDRIADGLGMKAATVTSVLLEMEVSGFLCRRLDGCYERA